MRQSAENLKIINESSISLWQRIILPRPGRKFVFDRTPGASYASEGEPYTCSYPPNVHTGAGDIYLTSVDRGTGCYDRISAWEYAKWHYV